MAKRKAAKRAKSARSGRKKAPVRPARRPVAKRKAKAQARARKKPIPQTRRKKPESRKAANRSVATPKLTKVARLDRIRRTLEETVQTPPSSLNMDRHASAARTGRAEIAENLRNHRGMTPDITAGDVDVDIEDAYFAGEEAPGGDNPTPDQDIVDDIGKALGVQYEDNEPLKASEKVMERDKHRWELDPASSEDYKERK
jgi:hypothetical protein